MSDIRFRSGCPLALRGRRGRAAVAVVFAIQSAVLIAVPGAASAAGATYVVSPAGNDGNPGTPAQPWRTISRALRGDSPAGAGDTVLIKAGRYDENVVNARSGSPGQPLVIAGESGTTIHPVRDGGYSDGVFMTTGTHDLVVQDLNVIADSATVWAGFAFSDVRNVVVQRNTATRTWASGIIVYPAAGAGLVTNSNVKILNNVLTDVNVMTAKTNLAGGAFCKVDGVTMKCDQESLSVWGVDGFEVAFNRLDGGSKEGLDVKDGSRNGSVHNNDISHQARLTSSGAGLYAAGGGPALYVDGGNAELFNVDVYANVVHDNFGDGITISDEVAAGRTHDVHVYNNVVYGNDATLGGSPLNSCLTALNGVEAVTFENNTCSDNGYSMWVQATSIGSPNGITFRNNAISGSRRDAVSFISGSNLALINNIFAPGSYRSTNASTDTGNQSVPSIGFLNAGAADFRLANGSPAIDAGVSPQFASRDFGGGVRPIGSRYDVGAFESGAGSGPPPPPVPTTMPRPATTTPPRPGATTIAPPVATTAPPAPRPTTPVTRPPTTTPTPTAGRPPIPPSPTTPPPTRPTRPPVSPPTTVSRPPTTPRPAPSSTTTTVAPDGAPPDPSPPTPAILRQDFSAEPDPGEIRPWHDGSVLSTEDGVMTVTGSPADVVYGSFAVTPDKPLTMRFDARSDEPVTLWLLIQAWDDTHKRVVYDERFQSTTSDWSNFVLTARLPSDAVRAAVAVYAPAGTWQIDNLVVDEVLKDGGTGGGVTTPELLYFQDFSSVPQDGEIVPWHDGSELATEQGVMTVSGRPADLIHGAFGVTAGTLTFGFDARSSEELPLRIVVQAWDASGNLVVFQRKRQTIGNDWSSAVMDVVLPADVATAAVSVSTIAGTWEIDNVTVTFDG